MRPHERRRGVARARRAAVGVKYNDRADTDPEVESGDEWGDGPTWDAATCAANLRTEAFAGARVFPEAAQFYPAAVTAAMLRASGAAYCAPARVLSIGEAAAGGKRVVTTDVGEIEAGVVVVATNAWAPELLPELAGQVSACRNQVIRRRRRRARGRASPRSASTAARASCTPSAAPTAASASAARARSSPTRRWATPTTARSRPRSAPTFDATSPNASKMHSEVAAR